MRSLGVLCARGASKRLPRKHLRPLLGLPLVAWMCRAAAASSLSRVVMTTEDAEIAAVAKANGADAPFLRSAHLVEDYAADYDIVIDAVDRIESLEGRVYDVVVMLQPTTPFTTAADIDGCLARLAADPQLGCCFAARKIVEPPQWMFLEDDQGRAVSVIDRNWDNDIAHKQLLPDMVFPSGAAYAIRLDALRAQKKIYCEPLAFHRMDSKRAIDIDEAVDLFVAESIGIQEGFAPAPLPHGDTVRPREA